MSLDYVPSAFGEAARELDILFTRFERLAGEIEHQSLGSPKGIERARALLVKFDESGKEISESMQALAKTLDEARERTDKAAQAVHQRALQIRDSQIEHEKLYTRFKTLGEMVRQINDAVVKISQPANGELSGEERGLLFARLPEINEKLKILVTEAKSLKDDAQEANLKSLERDADSLRQSLQSAHNRLNGFTSSGNPRMIAVDQVSHDESSYDKVSPDEMNH